MNQPAPYHLLLHVVSHELGGSHPVNLLKLPSDYFSGPANWRRESPLQGQDAESWLLHESEQLELPVFTSLWGFGLHVWWVLASNPGLVHLRSAFCC